VGWHSVIFRPLHSSRRYLANNIPCTVTAPGKLLIGITEDKDIWTLWAFSAFFELDVSRPVYRFPSPEQRCINSGGEDGWISRHSCLHLGYGIPSILCQSGCGARLQDANNRIAYAPTEMPVAAADLAAITLGAAALTARVKPQDEPVGIRLAYQFVVIP
jgi:hypothetical protein